MFRRPRATVLHAPRTGVRWASARAPQTLVEKIVQRYAVGLAPGQCVQAGDFVTIQPKHVMTHDNTAAVMQKFLTLQEGLRIKDPRQPVFTLDHDIQNNGDKNLKKYAEIERFAKDHGVDFYPAGRGIGHQIMLEEGYALPGTLVVASDSHSNTYGGVGALGTPVVRTDAAAIWATGRTWWTVPPVARVTFTGALPSGVSGKDVIVTLCGLFNRDEVLNHAVEFTGAVGALAMDDRLAIANMTTEWGALAGVFPVDDTSLTWVVGRHTEALARSKASARERLSGAVVKALEERWRSGDLFADSEAFYAKDLTLDLSTVRPAVSGPNAVKKYAPVTELHRRRIAIQKAYIVSCTNARASDLASAAEVLKGHRVAPGVKLYVAAASSEVQDASERERTWQTLLDAGAEPLPPGCGPCIGLGVGLLEKGEVGISATNRNFRGRMGHPDSECYLASPAVVAASAVAGYITAPAEHHPDGVPLGALRVNPPPAVTRDPVPVLPGFPAQVSGNLVFCHQDNLNTDGIYPGKYTYRDDLGPADQAKVVMENYDPAFATSVAAGDVLVGGENFGSGSSREQAATALKHRGIALVLAASFSETFKRNAFNNGFVALECPALVAHLRGAHPTPPPLTWYTKAPVTVDFAGSTVTFEGREFPIRPLGTTAQELVLTGGLEGWIRSKL